MCSVAQQMKQPKSWQQIYRIALQIGRYPGPLPVPRPPPPSLGTHQLLDPSLPLDSHHLLTPNSNSLDPIAPIPYHPLDPHHLLNPHHTYILTT